MAAHVVGAGPFEGAQRIGPRAWTGVLVGKNRDTPGPGAARRCSRRGHARAAHLASVGVQADFVRGAVNLVMIPCFALALCIRSDVDHADLGAHSDGVFDCAEPDRAGVRQRCSPQPGQASWPASSGAAAAVNWALLAHAARSGRVVDSDKALPLLHGCIACQPPRAAQQCWARPRPCEQGGSRERRARIASGGVRSGSAPSGTDMGMPSRLCSTCCGRMRRRRAAPTPPVRAPSDVAFFWGGGGGTACACRSSPVPSVRGGAPHTQ